MYFPLSSITPDNLPIIHNVSTIILLDEGRFWSSKYNKSRSYMEGHAATQGFLLLTQQVCTKVIQG